MDGDCSLKTGIRQELEEWRQAVALLVKFERGAGHLDELLDQATRLQMRWLVMQAFREWHSINRILEPRLGKPPRPVTLNLLRLAVAECLSCTAEDRPKVVHHAVEAGRVLKLSKAECGFVNAVLRTILREGNLERATVSNSHPEWLRKRWEKQFGEDATRKLMEWNQGIPAFHVSAEEEPPYAEATEWEGFYRIKRSLFREAIADLEAGKTYLQDPFTRIPVALLDPQPGESIMDLCAAPGGKSRLIARRMGGQGRLILVDKPGPRLERLRENAARFGVDLPEIIGSPVEELAQAGADALRPGTMDGVLIDVPCSNTGVIQKRPDVKIRLVEADIARLASGQLRLLKEAARWVRPGGRLVYSTCSLEEAENAAVVEAFRRDVPGWNLEQTILSLPWECGHDGGAAFLLTLEPRG